MAIRQQSRFNAVGILVVGATLIGLSLFMQTQSMDLSRFKLSQYLKGDFISPLWWEVIGVPMLSGVAYVAASFALWRRSRAVSTDLLWLSGCWIAACLLAVGVGGSGVFALVAMSFLLLCELARQLRGRGRSRHLGD